MGGLFDYDSRLFQFLLRVTDLVVLSLLWFVCSLPVFTAGAATAALYYVAMKLVRQRGGGAVEMFFHAFRQNFVPSLPVTGVLLAVAYLLYLDYSLLAPAYGGSGVFHGLCIVALALYAVVASFVFPVLARFRCTVRQAFRNALYIALGHPPVAVAVTAVNLLPIWVVVSHLDWVERLEPVFLLFGPGTAALLNAAMLVPVFRRYAPEEPENPQDGEA